EAAGGHRRDRVHVAHDLFERRFAGSGEPIRTAAINGREGLDQSLFFQSGDGAIEGARAELDAGEGGDVLDQGVSVLGTVGQAGQDEHRRVVLATQGRSLPCHHRQGTTYDVVVASSR